MYVAMTFISRYGAGVFYLKPGRQFNIRENAKDGRLSSEPCIISSEMVAYYAATGFSAVHFDD